MKQTPFKTERNGPDRAVSELLGAILVFALLALLLVLAQVTLVPALNQQVEFEHSQRVGGDATDLQSSLTRVSSTGISERVPVELGVSYPNRPLLINPPSVVGTVETGDEYSVTFQNVAVTDNAETADWWDGRDRVVTSRWIRYADQYNEYRNPGEIYIENGVLYRSFDSGETVVFGSGGPIEGRRISLVTVVGDLSAADQGTEALTVTPVSGPAKSVSVTNSAGGDPIRLSFESRLTAADWNDILADEIDPNPGDPDNDRYVATVTKTGSTVTVEMESGVTYDLRLAQVGVGSNIPDEVPAYVTVQPGQNSQVPVTGGQVVVEVRDRFNNPVSGVAVTFDAGAGIVFEDEIVTSDAQGRATATIEGRPSPTLATVTATIDTDGDGNDDPWETVEFDTEVGNVEDSDDPSARDDLNPNTDGVLVLTDSRNPDCGPNDDDCRLVLNFNNTVGENVTIESIRINTYLSNAPGASGEDFPDFARILGGTTEVGPEIVVGGRDVDLVTTGLDGVPPQIVSVPETTSASSPFELTLRLFEQDTSMGQPATNVFRFPSGDSLLLTVTYTSASGETERSTYVVTPGAD